MKGSVVDPASYDVKIAFKCSWMIEEDAKEEIRISVKQLCHAERDQQVSPDEPFAIPAVSVGC